MVGDSCAESVRRNYSESCDNNETPRKDSSRDSLPSSTSPLRGCLHNLTDSHCHLQLYSNYSLESLSHLVSKSMNSSLINRFVVCGVCPGEDWEKVSTIFAHYPEIIRPQFGFHPWWLPSSSSSSSSFTSSPSSFQRSCCHPAPRDSTEDSIVAPQTPTYESDSLLSSPMASFDTSSIWQRQLQEYLIRYPEAGVGECGLDKLILKRVPMIYQKQVLSQHLQIALDFNRPITLHCVQSWGHLLSSLQEFITKFTDGGGAELPCNMNFILHSCNKLPADLVHQFLKLKRVYFSFNGSKVLSPSEVRMVCQIPHEKLLLESDSPDQRPNWSLLDLMEGNIEEGEPLPRDLMKGRRESHQNEPSAVIYACYALAIALGVSPQYLADITTANAQKVYWFESNPRTIPPEN